MNSEFELGTYKNAGLWLDCELHKLIEAVVVAPEAPQYVEPAVREILTRFGFDPKLVVASKVNETVVPPDPESVRRELLQRTQSPVPGSNSRS